MATDSSSGTLPSSSRLTIDSSSSIARSKLSFLTSTVVFSAILRSQIAVFRRRLKVLVRAHCGGNSPAHQCADMGRDRLLEALQVVAALQHRYHPSPGTLIGDVHQLARDPVEVFRP